MKEFIKIYLSTLKITGFALAITSFTGLMLFLPHYLSMKFNIWLNLLYIVTIPLLVAVVYFLEKKIP